MEVEHNFKKYLKQKGILYFLFIIIISIFSLIYSLLIYFNKVSSSIDSINIVTFIIGIVSFFILGLLSGVVANKNGLLEGLIAGLFIILLALLVNLIISVPFVTNSFVKIATYTTSSAIGGIIGVNLRKNK